MNKKIFYKISKVMFIGLCVLYLVHHPTIFADTTVYDADWRSLVFNGTGTRGAGNNYWNIVGSGKNDGDVVRFKNVRTIDGQNIDALVQLSQTIPNAYKNDQNGQLYEIKLTNPNTENPAENISIEIQIPDGFTYIPDSMSNSLDLTMTITDGENLLVTFSPDAKLDPLSELVITYRLQTSCDVILGSHPLPVNLSYNDNTDSNTGVVTVKAGLIVVDISAEPEYVLVGDIVNVTVNISNTGEGSLFSIDFWSQWGTGLIDPNLIDDDLTPELNGQRFEILIDSLPAGESRFFKYTIKVNDVKTLSWMSAQLIHVSLI